MKICFQSRCITGPEEEKEEVEEEVEIFYDCNCSGALILSRLHWSSDSLPTAQSWFVSRDLSLSPHISIRQKLGEQILYSVLSAVTCTTDNIENILSSQHLQCLSFEIGGHSVKK